MPDNPFLKIKNCLLELEKEFMKLKNKLLKDREEELRAINTRTIL